MNIFHIFSNCYNKLVFPSKKQVNQYGPSKINYISTSSFVCFKIQSCPHEVIPLVELVRQAIMLCRSSSCYLKHSESEVLWSGADSSLD